MNLPELYTRLSTAYQESKGPLRHRIYQDAQVGLMCYLRLGDDTDRAYDRVRTWLIVAIDQLERNM